MYNYDDDFEYPTLEEAFHVESDEDFDFEDVDCVSCGLKFYVRPSSYVGTDKKYPTKCTRCRKGLPPLYEY